MLFDASHEADTICMQCGIQLTRSNRWSSWLCIDCHEAELDAQCAERPALLEAMRRYNQPTMPGVVKAIGATLLLVGFGGMIHFLTIKKNGETPWNS
jgi:predicted RNA-binding Zn-ribbon protein involved in translation (DUF1610 family)